MEIRQFYQQLAYFQEKFGILAEQYDGTLHPSTELETIIDEYSTFVTREDYRKIWIEAVHQAPLELLHKIEKLRSSSALCVEIMEKYRALKLLKGASERTDYFHNIEACIEKEFGSFHVTADSKVVMVGSGSFPMTPLLIAKRTGARVTGIDIDEEAIELGRRVIDRLGDGLDITLEQVTLEQLAATRDATHIIFSSTIPNKYELLDQLHPITQEQVVVAMRYGDQLKSLFNYPMREVDEHKWRLVQNVIQPSHVFDIALYQHAVSQADNLRRSE
ncbi:SAM-dependent methyltransferase [Paenibacillus sp. YPG26]|uniref:SAM-dependent methyltransferase n=1 Tax=Paenibacillus sp. YPG26 TaxID=2878915 RepID=UPI0020418577|nr:SAM-dependent methyltransferase [Paenibacillus sp. YPG26]USB31756.1 SAM-dependent methyltransferase [Paenibacillus sp. YPG26]